MSDNHVDVERAHNFKRETEKYYFELRAFLEASLLTLTGRANEDNMTPEDKADYGLAVRQMELRFEEIRKDFTSRTNLVGKLLAVYMSQHNLQNPDKMITKVTGKTCYAFPAVQQIPVVVPLNKEAGRAFAKLYGATDELLDSGFFKPDFRRIQKVTNENMSQGRSTLGIEKTYSEFKCNFRPRRKKSQKEKNDG